ncbi:glycosyltransferase family 2 protein [Pedobacter sp. MC2016-14]|uniref:glycosyltransferase n=1 Tax=Pedobacter sp. MC2016-14 TaxID=2897327 RepID=UPI001E46ECC2|nr:glycosyltransferase [Pedobacter sp. MC2016-14]MCD0490219.1 glycosyltransferase family 2 protein [Pedobacter sp. MC2016-14]
MWLFEVPFIALQLLIGYNLVFPVFLYLLWLIFRKQLKQPIELPSVEADYGIIVTAYEQTNTLPFVVDSILKLKYSNYLVYIVADKCDISALNFNDSRVVLLRPEETLASNTKSHLYAMDHFLRVHDRITIIDSDNLVHADYLNQLNTAFEQGFVAVQGVREAKNLNTTIASLDAARDIYYHFYDGKVLFELGSSATLAGSGMAFEAKLYYEFLVKNPVTGAGFDKVLQNWLVKQGIRIAFAENAFVYDEKTSKSEQLVQQRSRWINTWFKYFKLGFGILWAGITKWNCNQFLFGIVLLRPPLFLFIIASGIFMFINIFISLTAFLIWCIAFLLFILGFYLALVRAKVDARIYKSLINIPKFIYLQVISLLKSKNANKASVATTHYHNESINGINSDPNENLPV